MKTDTLRLAQIKYIVLMDNTFLLITPDDLLTFDKQNLKRIKNSQGISGCAAALNKIAAEAGVINITETALKDLINCAAFRKLVTPFALRRGAASKEDCAYAIRKINALIEICE